MTRDHASDDIPELTEALNGRFRDHHAFPARLYLDQYQVQAEKERLAGDAEQAERAPAEPG